MRILVLGRDGQMGRALADQAWPLGVQPIWAGRKEADVTDATALTDLLTRSAPDMIVNCAAYTQVDKAESEPGRAFAVNARAPGTIAAYCRSAQVPVLHFSTDYVFDGSKDSPYTEDDPVAPLGVYGASKAAGEDAIGASGADHWIWRTAWVFGPHRANFVRTMLRAAMTKDRLNVVDDQIGTPAPTSGLAAAVLTLIDRWRHDRARAPHGTYHVSGDEPVSWHGLATAVFEAAETVAPDWPRPELTAIPTAQWPTPARRPANSRLDGARAASALGIRPIAWRSALPSIVAAIIEDLRETSP
ncbi:MAG: dTDP-4-dehydrorhamnose reductase [Pseudomonadota bacterium]